MNLSNSKLAALNKFQIVLVFIILTISSCGEKSKFSQVEEMIPPQDKGAYKTIYLIGENSCNSCYGHIINSDKDKSVVYVFSKSGKADQFKSFFQNLKIQRNFALLDYVANYTSDFKGPYKINIQHEKITDIISYNN